MSGRVDANLGLFTTCSAPLSCFRKHSVHKPRRDCATPPLAGRAFRKMLRKARIASGEAIDALTNNPTRSYTLYHRCARLLRFRGAVRTRCSASRVFSGRCLVGSAIGPKASVRDCTEHMKWQCMYYVQDMNTDFGDERPAEWNSSTSRSSSNVMLARRQVSRRADAETWRRSEHVSVTVRTLP